MTNVKKAKKINGRNECTLSKAIENSLFKAIKKQVPTAIADHVGRELEELTAQTSEDQAQPPSKLESVLTKLAKGDSINDVFVLDDKNDFIPNPFMLTIKSRYGISYNLGGPIYLGGNDPHYFEIEYWLNPTDQLRAALVLMMMRGSRGVALPDLTNQ